MIEEKVEALQKQFEELTKVDQALYTELQKIQTELDLLTQRTNPPTENLHHSFETKITYLQEVNEQMFQQNIRLRQYIEHCMEAEVIPTHKEYSKALQGDN